MGFDSHPVILTVYNRPEHTGRVLRTLRAARVEPLYVFSDGAKDAGDAERVRAVRQLIRGIDWTEPRLHFRETNLGLGRSIIQAVDTVLASHDTMMLLEDDCIPYPAFFDFMYRCLGKYRDSRVMSIGGYSPPIPNELLEGYEYDAYFVTSIETWGWGTWRRAWQHYERDYASAYERVQRLGIDYARDGKAHERNTEYAIQGRKDGVHPFSVGWMLALFLHDGYCVYPTRSLVRNIGFDGSGASCGLTDYYDVPDPELWKPTRFPDEPFVYPGIRAVYKEFYR